MERDEDNNIGIGKIVYGDRVKLQSEMKKEIEMGIAMEMKQKCDIND